MNQNELSSIISLYIFWSKDVFQHVIVKSGVKRTFFLSLAQDLLEDVVAKFNILDEGRTLQLFERELSVTQQDIFYRKISPNESPLELFMLWKINGERKTLVLTGKYKICNEFEAQNYSQI